MSYQITGNIHSISQAEIIDLKNGSKLHKREFIIYVEEGPELQYVNYIKFEMVGEDKIKKLDAFSVSDKVDVNFNLRGRLWTNKEDKEMCFSSLLCWKIEKATPVAPESPLGTPKVVNSGDEGGDHLPF